MDAILIYLFGGLPVGLLLIYAVIGLFMLVARLVKGASKDKRKP